MTRGAFHVRSPRTAAALLVFILCLGAGASVFRILGRTWSGWVPTGSLPWEKAYEAEMVVNGKRTELHVFTARYNQPVEEQLKQTLESVGADFNTSAVGSAGIATLNDYSVSYMISAPPSEPVKFIFLSYTDPAGSVPQHFPVELYSNGEVLSIVSNVGSRSECATVRTSDTPVEVHEFYRQLLLSQGWAQVKPSHAAYDERTDMAVYRKKEKICFIDVVPGENISSTITVLVENGD